MDKAIKCRVARLDCDCARSPNRVVLETHPENYEEMDGAFPHMWGWRNVVIDFKASEEFGTVYCDGCKEWASFYALTEEEFIDEVLASGWVAENGEWKCPTCQRIEGLALYLRTRGGGVIDG